MAQESTQEEAQVASPEATGDESGASIGRRVDPAFRRNLLIIGSVFGACALAVVAVFALRSGSPKELPGGSAVNMGAPASPVPNRAQGMSPQMRQDLITKQDDEKRRAMAGAGGNVYIPPETLNMPVPLAASASQVGGIPAPTPMMAEAAQLQTQSQAQIDAAERQRQQADLQAHREEALKMRRDGMKLQLGRLLQADATAAAIRVAFTDDSAGAQARSSPVGASAGAEAPASAPTAIGPKLADSLEIFPAETASPIDTYRTKYASARIVGGRLDGAFLVGQISQSPQSEEGLLINFTQMRLGSKTYSIDAIALDNRQSTDAMDADVDHRYIQRDVLPVLTAALGAYAQAKSQTGSTVINIGSNGGSLPGVQVPAPTSQQAAAAGEAAGVSILQKQVNTAAEKPLQITLPESTAIGVMFRKPVMLQ